MSRTSRVRPPGLHLVPLLAGLLLASWTAQSADPRLVARPIPEGDLTAFADLPFVVNRTVSTQITADGIPGAAVAVVKNGQVLHLQGYGYRDLRQQKPVSAETTLFRAGSVSKLLTWTAAMQLVEQGKLDLHTDLNHYLTDLQIPATYPAPITMAHLLTHTPGFEDRAFGFYARNAVDLIPLGRFLGANIPARIFPPGEVSAYSNYGASLAGLIVEQLSGLPFERYIEDRILAPLGMTRSSFSQPLPSELATQLATGYRNSLQPGDFEWHLAGPAGALSTTASDMARFMIAHLQKGRLGATRILRETTAAAMQQQRFTNHRAVSGLTYGFQKLRIADQRILGQPGDTLYFSTALYLLPEQKLGLYVSYNRGRASHAPMELLHALLARYVPSPGRPTSLPPLASKTSVARFAGSYRSTRRNETTLEKLQELFAPVRVHATASGLLHISGLRVVPEALWIETEPGVFRDLFGPEVVAFREDEHGCITHLFEGNFPLAGYTRLPLHGAPEVHYALLGFCVPVFLGSMLVWTLGAWRNRGSDDANGFSGRRAHEAAVVMCVSNLVFLAGMVVVVTRGRELLFGTTPLLHIVLLLPMISTVMTALTLGFAGVAWRLKYWTLWGRLHYLLVALAGLAFIGSLHYWNLLGYRL